MKALVAIVVVAVLGLVVFLLMGGEKFGVSDAMPLGDPMEIGAWMRERELPSKPMDRKMVEHLFGGEKEL